MSKYCCVGFALFLLAKLDHIIHETSFTAQAAGPELGRLFYLLMRRDPTNDVIA